MQSPAVAITLLSLATIVLALGWAFAARRFARLLRTATERMQLAAPGNALPEIAGDMPYASDHAKYLREALELVHNRALETERARRGLEAALLRADKLTAFGQASAVLAHQLGSPLQVVNGRARTIVECPGLPPEIVRCARIVEQETERMTAAIERLLPLGRRCSVLTEAISLDRVLPPLIETLEADADQRGIRLQFVSRHAIPPVKGDADGVRQLVANLVVNACRATARGGRIRVVLSRGWTTSLNERRQRTVRLAVEDTGCGIPHERRDKIFEPFFTTWVDQGGLGLGLTIARAIVLEHAGSIAVVSTPGKGTTVTIELPILAAKNGNRA